MSKRLLFMIFSIFLTGILLLCSCEKNEKASDPTTKNYDNGISYEEEVEDAKLEFKKVNVERFYGSWEAKSGDAHYLFGNIDLNIKDDGSWSGNIADDDMSGTWSQKDGGIEIKNEWINALLVYTNDDVLIMQQIPNDEDGRKDIINTVLSKK